MDKAVLVKISDLAVVVGAVGAVVYIYFSIRGGGFKPLRGADASISTILAASALILWAGSRFFSWLPIVFFHLAIAAYMAFMGFASYRRWKQKW
jgi:hypothetical protein